MPILNESLNEFGPRARNRSSRCGLPRLIAPREMEQIINRLEHGSVLTKFFNKAKPEKKFFKVKRNTQELVWSKLDDRQNQSQNILEGSIDLRLVKEVRVGSSSKIFESWLDDNRKWEKSQCFVLLYGQRFVLKSLACLTATNTECDHWVRGLRFLTEEAITSPYPLIVETWLCREFLNIVGGTGALTLKDLKPFLSKISCKMSTEEMKRQFNLVDSRQQGEISFESFYKLYYNLLDPRKIFYEHFSIYSADKERVTLKEFLSFLQNQTKDPSKIEKETVILIIKEFSLDQNNSDDSEPSFYIHEFMNYVFSKHNQVWDTEYDKISHDMDQPLPHYWIASSHNTYLTGDQIRSESSTNAYARALRMGCRCIELDCWDGPDGYPLIYHGHTITTRIKFLDALKTIKDHAFATSEHPVILSIENHCSLQQQRKMASAFKKILGDMLLTKPVDKNREKMPSPNQLKRKFIIKHKKLSEKSDSSFSHKNSEENGHELEIGTTIKSGILFLLDGKQEKQWKSHLFMLTTSKMYYAECQQNHGDGDENEERPLDAKEEEITKSNHNEELHYGEKWFHGKIGRPQATELLRRYSYLGNGTFLVRESSTFVGDYTLSILWDGKDNHIHIRSKQENGSTKYFLIDSVTFDSIYSLVTNYQTHPLRATEFSTCLTHPVPQINSYEEEVWYHSRITRSEAESLLNSVSFDGGFLVRPSENEENAYAITFRADNCIKHCRIRQEGRLFVIGNARYECLKSLIDWYQTHPLYKSVKLVYPINRQNLKNLEKPIDGNGSPYMESSYLDPENCHSGIIAKALFDYVAQKDDELSFPRNAIIKNVVKQGSDWCRGDYGTQKNRLFPANVVQELNITENNYHSTTELTPLGGQPKGSIDIVECSVVHSTAIQGKEWVFKIASPSQIEPIAIAASNEEEMTDWIKQIRDTAQHAHEKICQSKKDEKKQRIAKELSNLIIYCRAVPFMPERIGNFTEMSSFPENKIEKWISPSNYKFIMNYHRSQISRVYPGMRRLDSSNYDPVRMWNAGIQMVALNYQTPDRAMQLNQGKFLENGQCGYLLRPQFMLNDDSFSAYDKSSVKNCKPLSLNIRVIAARHLMKNSRGTVSPFVEIEIAGAEFDNSKCKTKTIHDDGFSPCWEENFVFEITCPDLAIIRFVAYDEDVFGDPSFLGQASYPLKSLKDGYRNVPLKNEFSEPFALTSLLVKIEKLEDRSTLIPILRS